MMWLSLVVISNFALLYFYFFIAKKFKIVDQPRAERINKQVIVRGGGLCVIISFLVQYFLLSQNILQPQLLLYSSIALLFITIFFFIEDIHEISYYIRFTVQFIVAGIVVSYLFWQTLIEIFPFLNKYVIWAVLVIGLVWFMNLYNFMDGSDGMSSTNTIMISIGSITVCMIAISIIEIGAIGSAVYDVMNLRKPQMFDQLNKVCKNGNIKYYNNSIKTFDIPNNGKVGLDRLNNHIDLILEQHTRISSGVTNNLHKTEEKIKQKTQDTLDQGAKKIPSKIGSIPFANSLIDKAKQKLNKEANKQIDKGAKKVNQKTNKFISKNNDYVEELKQYQTLLKSPFAYFVADKLPQKLIAQCHNLEYRLHLIITSIALLLSIVPFHILNRSPARIILGDSGSVAIGLISGVMMLNLVKIFGLHGMFYALILCSYYIFETTTTLMYSITHKYNPLKPHLRHSFHRAILAGAKHLSIARLVMFFNLLMIIVACFISPSYSITKLFQIFAIVMLMNIIFRKYLKNWKDSNLRLLTTILFLLLLVVLCYFV